MTTSASYKQTYVDRLPSFFFLYVSRQNSFLFVHYICDSFSWRQVLQAKIVGFRMSFKSTETPHCPRCGHAAFQAESIPAAGKMWHKICFRCGN